MKSISTTAATVTALTLFVFSAQAQQNTKIANIEELLKLSQVESMSQQINSQIRALTVKQLEATAGSDEARAKAQQVVDKLMTQIQDRLSWDKMKPEYIRLYDEVYTEDEIAGILAFYRSPAGQAYLKKMPQLMTRSMDIAQRRMADVLPEIQRIAKEAAESKGGETKK